MIFDYTTAKPVIIIGCGPAGPEYLTPVARDYINQAEILIGSKRLLELYANSHVKKIEVASNIISVLSEIDTLINKQLTITVLVTGDTGAASLSATIIRKFGHNRCKCIPGISSIQLACANLCIDWIDAFIINAHKEIPIIATDTIQLNQTIIILCGNKISWNWVLSIARKLVLTHDGFQCTDLGLKSEVLSHINHDDLSSLPDGGGNTILVWKKKESEQ